MSPPGSALSLPVGPASHGLAHDASTSQSERLRKRLRNRFDQRARRARLKEVDLASQTPSKRKLPLFEIDRWRLDEVGSRQATARRRGNHAETSVTTGYTKVIICQIADKSPLVNVEFYGQRLESISSLLATKPPSWQIISPLSDHLLHLVNYNAFRGFLRNKILLSQVTEHYFKQSSGDVVKANIMEPFSAKTVIIPTVSDMPICLCPTELQRRLPHRTYIDFLPFPRIRDNLILNEHRFNHWELILDLIGYPVSRIKCLILWGDPDRPQDWEATPGFMEKWGWVTEGYPEILQYSNQWRISRGEEPMVYTEAKYNV
ncbi:hypothetical protein T069G_00017 [Trichoderma breve]|uniref:BZIP domain-containing protein n=1 Tax=Trichoderma breve TaxID=2034170 RepID=A0A9W9EB54_9HYPO|nr:hypothetical protein T069G_00017 [Trichoderma breve]KAJ4863487.1 hypothetical protein T069G_00017 [Trichoderma breve]